MNLIDKPDANINCVWVFKIFHLSTLLEVEENEMVTFFVIQFAPSDHTWTRTAMELVKFALKIHMAQLQTQLHATAVLMEKLLEAKLDRPMSVLVVSKLFPKKK